MSEYRDQGEGSLAPGRGFAITRILMARRGVPTAVDFNDGSTVVTSNASYGRDIGEAWEHLYLDVPGEVLFTSSTDVLRLRDPKSDDVLFDKDAPPR